MPRSDASTTKTTEDRLLEFAVQNGMEDIPGTATNFIQILRAYQSLGLGYGFMIQLIEWEWQASSGGESWGPEALNLQIKALSEEVQDLRDLLEANGIEPPV
jgi:hypothetical protein